MREHRSIVIKGEVYLIPPRLYRYRNGKTGGWLVSYTKNKETVSRSFPDNHYNNEANSYQVAMRYLTSKVLPIIYALPSLKDEVSIHKQSDTPVGITGPLWKIKPSQLYYCVFQVSIPRVDQASKLKTIYIGNENTWQRNYYNALERANEIRDNAVEEYRQAAEEMRLNAIADLDGEVRRPSYKESRVVHINFKRNQLKRNEFLKVKRS